MFMTKILIGCPTYDGKVYCLEKYVQGLKALKGSNLSFLIVDNSKEEEYAKLIGTLGVPATHINYLPDARDRVTVSRNLLRNVVLEGEYDYFLSLEQDIIPEPEIIEKMLAHKKDIVAAPYCLFHEIDGKRVLVPVVYDVHPKDPKGLWYISKEELQKPQLKEVKGFGLGCVLISRKVLEQIKFRHGEGYDDMMFCKDAIEKGFKLYLDTTLKLNHLVL